MSLSVKIKDSSTDSVVILIEGEVDFSTVDHVLSEIDKQNGKTISLDCSGITFIDSTGIGLLLRSMLELKEKERIITLNSIPPQINEVLNEMGVFEILNEFDGR